MPRSRPAYVRSMKAIVIQAFQDDTGVMAARGGRPYTTINDPVPEHNYLHRILTLDSV